MPAVCGIDTCKNKECPSPKDPSMVDSSDRVSDHIIFIHLKECEAGILKNYSRRSSKVVLFLMWPMAKMAKFCFGGFLVQLSP